MLLAVRVLEDLLNVKLVEDLFRLAVKQADSREVHIEDDIHGLICVAHHQLLETAGKKKKEVMRHTSSTDGLRKRYLTIVHLALEQRLPLLVCNLGQVCVVQHSHTPRLAFPGCPSAATQTQLRAGIVTRHRKEVWTCSLGRGITRRRVVCTRGFRVSRSKLWTTRAYRQVDARRLSGTAARTFARSG